MTERQQRIYNMYLQAASLGVGHPFKMRKDFDGFEESNPEDYAAILKLEKLFNDLPGLNIYDYFAAPYKLDKERFNYKLELKWYLTFMGMKYSYLSFPSSALMASAIPRSSISRANSLALPPSPL